MTNKHVFKQIIFWCYLSDNFQFEMKCNKFQFLRKLILFINIMLSM